MKRIQNRPDLSEDNFKRYTALTLLEKKEKAKTNKHEKMLKITSYFRTANQNSNEVSCDTSQNGHHENVSQQYIPERERRKQTLLQCWGECNWYSSWGGQLGGSFNNKT